MSPFQKPVVLDNNCVSNFQNAESLETILTLWPFKGFLIPQRVLKEAENWPAQGAEVCRILNKLHEGNIIEIITINEESEEELDAYLKLRLKGPALGEGESESIAMAMTRGYIVATDDQIATEHCHQVFPSIEVITTADILKMAKADGLLKQSQINRMWRLIKEKQSK